MLLAAILVLVLILLASGFFSGSETALMSLNRYRLRSLEKKKRSARLIRDTLAYPEKVLGTILTGNVFVNTAAGAIVTYGVTVLVTDPERTELAITIATIALTALILVFGEMIPKSYAARHPEKTSLLVIGPIVLLIKLLGPVVKVLTVIAHAFLRLLRQKTGPLRQDVTLEEIKAVVYAGSETDAIHASKRLMLRRVLELGEKRLAEVMVPRTEMVAVERNASLEEVLAVVRKERCSRMPVFRETLDNIEGIVYSKDIIALGASAGPFEIGRLLRKAYFLPDSSRVEQALEQLQRHRVHMALVVDEHGGVEGLVTLEDLLEEIVGEIEDELDEEPEPVKRLSEGALLIDASIPVKELNERCGLGLPELADYNTLAGLILTSLGRIPASGEELIVQGVKLQVDKVAHRRILRVIASREPPAAVRESTEVNGVSAVAVEVQSSTSPKKK